MKKSVDPSAAARTVDPPLVLPPVAAVNSAADPPPAPSTDPPAAATPDLTAADPPHSQVLTEALSAAQARIAAITSEALIKLDAQFDAVAAATELDATAVAGLQKLKGELLGEREALNRRIEILAQQKAKVERLEASARMDQIAHELEAITEEGASARTQWDALMLSLIERARAFSPLLQREQSLRDEREWLRTLNEFSGLTPVPGVPYPQTDDIRPLQTVIERLSRPQPDPFSQKRQKLLDSRKQETPPKWGISSSWAKPEEIQEKLFKEAEQRRQRNQRKPDPLDVRLSEQWSGAVVREDAPETEK